jgi:hypothetical protein
MQSELARLMHGERRWVEVNPLIPVYKSRDGRRSGVIVFPEGEDEGSRPIRLEGGACVWALEVEGPCLTALGAVACAQVREVEETMVLELSLPKPGGHVLSP